MRTKRAGAAQAFAALLTTACLTLTAWAVFARDSHAQDAKAEPDAKAATPAPAPARRSAIYGRAVSEATGRPLRRARISVMTLDGSRVDQAALTDAQGAYRISDLPPGLYVVWADVGGMLTPAGVSNGLGDSAYDVEELRRNFEVVELDGKNEREVSVRARRGGAITGRVAYSDGDPAVGVMVYLMRRSEGAPARRLTQPYGPSASSPRTDDRGVYRFAGLPAGEYLVVVAEPADHRGSGVSSGTVLDTPAMADIVFNQLLLTTFYPSASSPRAAEAVTVRAGEEQSEINVLIPDRELRSLAGVVRTARGGRPLREARVSVVPRDEQGGSARPFFDMLGAATTDAEGRWRLREIPDGLYTLYVDPPEQDDRGESGVSSTTNRNSSVHESVVAEEAARRRQRRRLAPLSRELRVSGDVAELVVELGEGARVSGTVTVEGGKSAPYLHIYAAPAARTLEEAAGAVTASAPVSAGTFDLEGLTPGKYHLYARDYSEEGGLYLKSMTWQGRDLLREALDIGEGTQVEGVRIVYGSDPGVLQVRASRPEKRPAYNVSVIILPADLSQWTTFLPTQTCLTGVEGTCRVTVAPGDYLVVAADPTDLLRNPDPKAELRRRAADAPRVTLRPNEAKTLNLVVE